jgi:hypothetical protein
MDSSLTLQDFVLNLIYDPAARSAFELDPETTLQHAGLGDVTAADVQQVIPLVVDYTPVAGATGLTEVDDLTTGVANLDIAGAVAHLQTITAHVALAPGHGAGADVNVASVHTAAIGIAGEELVSGASLLSGSAVYVHGGADGPSTGQAGVSDLSAVNDPALNLDAGVAVVNTVDTVVPGAGHLVPDSDIQPVSTLDSAGNLPSSIDQIHAPGLDVVDIDGATSSIGSLITPDDPVHAVQGVVSGVADTGHGITGVLPGIGHDAGLDFGHDFGHDIGAGSTDLHP